MRRPILTISAVCALMALLVLDVVQVLRIKELKNHTNQLAIAYEYLKQENANRIKEIKILTKEDMYINDVVKGVKQ